MLCMTQDIRQMDIQVLRYIYVPIYIYISYELASYLHVHSLLVGQACDSELNFLFLKTFSKLMPGPRPGFDYATAI